MKTREHPGGIFDPIFSPFFRVSGGKQTTFSTSHLLDAKTAKKLSGDNIRQHVFENWVKVVQTTCFGDLGQKCCLETTYFTWPLAKILVRFFFGQRLKKNFFALDNRFWRFWAKNVVWRQHILHGHLAKISEKSNTRQPVFEN